MAGKDLTALLKKYGERVQKRGKTMSHIARDSWLDESYVRRLLNGERSNPSRDVLILLCCWGLGLSVEEFDEVLQAADYKPLVVPVEYR